MIQGWAGDGVNRATFVVLAPLSWAASHGDVEVVRMLLEGQPGDLNGMRPVGRQTPLSWAAGGGHEGVVRLLLEKGVDLDCKCCHGRTALSWAARRGHEKVTQLLLKTEMDVNNIDDCGMTALSLATRH